MSYDVARVCNSWLLSITVSTRNNSSTNWCRWVLHEKALNFFIFSHHHDAGTFVPHNICLYICAALYVHYRYIRNKIWCWKGLCVYDRKQSHIYLPILHVFIYIHVEYRMDLLVWKRSMTDEDILRYDKLVLITLFYTVYWYTGMSLLVKYRWYHFTWYAIIVI